MDLMADIRSAGFSYEDGIGLVARGFWDRAEDIYDWISYELDKDDMPNVILTGHSLGGSIAQLVAAKMIEAGMRVGFTPESCFKACVTFAAARAGELDILGDHPNCIAYERPGDPIPWMPPWRKRSKVKRVSIGSSSYKFKLHKNHDIDWYISDTPYWEV
jgi:pimeloyl-ACP methyl ester carboxylesterase